MSDPFGLDPLEPSAADATPGDVAFPWPPPPGTSLLDSLVGTVANILTAPARFFAAMPIDAPIVPAVVFMLILTYAGAGVQLFWDMVLPDPAWVPATLRSSDAEAVAGFFLAGPFALAVTTLVALLVHIGLIVFGARGAHARNTVATFYYTSATAILQIVPWLGVVLAGVASIVIAIVGVRAVHGTTTGRAAAAVLLPIIGFAMLVAAGVVLLVVLGLTSGLMSR